MNQFTVSEGRHTRRPDIVVFVNGLPLGLVELKNAADEDATIWTAYAQLQTYQAEIPSLLAYNAAQVISDGRYARIGSLTANQEWFKVWRTIDGTGDSPKSALELEVLVRGVFDQRRFLELLEHAIVFEEEPDTGAIHKIIAGYHQFHAVSAAIAETVRASGTREPRKATQGDGGLETMHGGKPGDRRAGVVWHTQGSGKSFTMLFFAARVIREPAMQNPTLVVLTDRNDLDDQLFGQFQRCHDLLGQIPVQATSREKLRELLTVASGGLVFTTIQKFLPEKVETMPELSPRQNIVVIADEAHRSQYGFAGKVNPKTGEITYGFDWGKWTTGTPVERLQLIPAGQEHILEQEDGKNRWAKLVTELSRAFALCAASDEATAIRDDVSFFQALQAALGKQSSTSRKTPEQIEAAIRQLVSRAITTTGQVIDVFTAAGLPRPDIGILSEQFLAEVRSLKHKNVAAELLAKLLKDEIKVRSKRNLVQSKIFSEKLKQTLNAYHNRAIATQEVIEELIKLAKELDSATKRGESLGLTDDEVAFYDALAANESAVQAMGDDKLKVIAAELITQVRQNVTIDWTLRESARAKIRVLVRRILNKYGYPPDLQDAATQTVLDQAALLCQGWTSEPVE